MDLVLYDPGGGYFSGPILRSEKGGDFLTSPEVSRLFGETLAVFVTEERERVGAPFRLVEVGGGSGSLLRPLLEVVDLDVWAVEVSGAARTALAEVVGRQRVTSSLSEVPGPFNGVILANELVDNLPMAVAQLTDGRWRERWVGHDDDRLVLVDAEPRPEVVAWLDSYAGDVEDGGWVEVQIAAGNWIETALAAITAGSVVIIDYGDTAENLVPRRRDGTLRTYRSHHLGPHPLAEPGATDITADVNFTAMMATAEQTGAEVRLWRQDDFLGAYGLRERLSDLRHRELELARGGDEMQRLRVRTERTEVETLLHPRGLGDFRVLVASKSMPSGTGHGGGNVQ